ncbi:hypothetical protein OPV22_005121 [Ensete ventricosum]|uniref:WAT1-related protein n=1 Tax=Ensete ventricosum TaxID=4639 RepID=A0AAV8RC51_ENSVE|nr:hypothetical protein OPV22_005121 [Ensete ventricosum]
MAAAEEGSSVGKKMGQLERQQRRKQERATAAIGEDCSRGEKEEGSGCGRRGLRQGTTSAATGNGEGCGRGQRRGCVAATVESIGFRYPADLSLSAMVAICGTIQAVTVAAFMERDASAWKIHWKGSFQLVAILFGGILVTGLSYLARMWCIHRKGPVFATAFSPLLVVFSFLLHTLVLGGATHPPTWEGSIESLLPV